MSYLRIGIVLICSFIVYPTVSVAQNDTLRITFLGTGAPRPSFERYGPSILVEAGEHKFLVDAGWGVRQRMFAAGGFELLTTIDHVVLTHLHYDHTMGLADVWLTGWLYGRRVPLHVQGPAGTVAMLDHIKQANKWDLDNRRLVGVPMMGTAIAATDIAPGVIFDRDGLKITAFLVEHKPLDRKTGEELQPQGQAFGYRVDFGEHSAVFSGDTRPSDNLVRYAQDVDVLIHETQVLSPGNSREAVLANVSLGVHTTPEQAGGIFSRTKPRMAVYSHIIPPDTAATDLAAATKPFYKGPLAVAHDYMTITIGAEIVVGERARYENLIFEKSRVLK